MNCKQHITFAANGVGYPVLKELPVTLESDEPRHLESGVINLYPDITYQTIDGFGGALTDSSAYLLSTLPEEKRNQALELLFTGKGNHFNMIRVPVDSCDFSLDAYQAVEDPMADPELKTFSMERNFHYILPVLKEAVALCDRPVSVLLSPWSPPQQWKTPPARPKNDASVYGGSQEQIDFTKPQRCNGGSLKPEYYGSWAEYLVKLTQAYLDQGIPVNMLTLQNESIAATPWDSCVWTPSSQKAFLRDHLYPAMERAGLVGRVGLYIWDHNKERVLEWTREVIDEVTRPMVEGVAFHWYSGDHFEAVKMTAEQFPDLKLAFTECCTSSNVPHDPGPVSHKTPETQEWEGAAHYAHDIIGNLNSGMERWFDWNFCLDKEGLPRRPKLKGCLAGIIVDNGDFSTNLIFAYVGHFSRYIQPGAQRMGFSRCDHMVELTAARNPDGTLAVIVLNRGTEDRGYAIRIQGNVIRVHFPARTISTFVLE